jgi:hypothetical protein
MAHTGNTLHLKRRTGRESDKKNKAIDVRAEKSRCRW